MPKKMYVEDEEDTEDVTCPVCGKPVGLDVTACPFCGAEFEEEEIEEVEAEVEEEAATEETSEEAVDEEEQAECPVCGKPVGLSVASCPYCGAEFEEEEVDEVIEVEEAEAEEEEPAEAETEAVAKEAAEEEFVVVSKPAASITDLRIIGFSLVLLGIIGSQIAFMIDWYWTWVPPIEDNLIMFIAIPAVLLVVGIVVFLLVKRALAGGRKLPNIAPSAGLSMLLFGIFALVLVLLWDPINSALQESNWGVGGAFIGILVVGILAMFMGSRMTSKSGSAA
ncbi:MAG: zinc ribbon domain-containing protein [Thermoplasmata archaeon]|jgi:endogenous inhibitor of DNA gyrase (YacG/DUF329 family)|nr:zinc ribbon domain-containing protein [Thermoplasmata archaeon]